MSVITVAGAGAFGTSLAIALAEDNRDVSLWGRNAASMEKMAANRENAKFLPGISLPQSLNISCDPSVLEDAGTILLCVPTQHLRAFANDHRTTLVGKTCVLCCKGVEKDTGLLPTEILADVVATSRPAVLTGPGFASEIAAGLPTALTLALDTDDAPQLQGLLSTRSLRLYLSDDPIANPFKPR